MLFTSLVGGLNVEVEDHLLAMVELAIDMMHEMDRLNKRIPLRVNLRIGINSGTQTIANLREGISHYYRRGSCWSNRENKTLL